MVKKIDKKWGYAPAFGFGFFGGGFTGYIGVFVADYLGIGLPNASDYPDTIFLIGGFGGLCVALVFTYAIRMSMRENDKDWDKDE